VIVKNYQINLLKSLIGYILLVLRIGYISFSSELEAHQDDLKY